MSNVAGELRKLTDHVSEMNHKIDKAHSAILDLTMRVGSVERTLASGPGSAHTHTRDTGYVNWTADHDPLKAQGWVKLSMILKLMAEMDDMFYRMRRVCPDIEEKKDLPNNIRSVNEETRFPQDEPYVNTSCPHVNAALAALKNGEPGPEHYLLRKFSATCKDYVYTCSSFEEKYQLKWQSYH